MKNESKNIAILLPSLAGGGAERVASWLSRFYTSEGHQVFVFTEKIRTGYEFAGKIIQLRPEMKWNLGNQEINELLALESEVRSKKKQYGIDISISFMEKYNMANVLSKRKDKVLVRVCTTLSARDDLKGIWYHKALIRLLYNRADKVVVLSGYGKKDMIMNYGIRREKLRIIPNAAVYREVKSDIPWLYGEKAILSVNRLHPIKQQGILIDMMAEVVKKVPDAKLLLVGNDTEGYGRSVRRLVKEYRLEDNVVFTGQVSDVEYYMGHCKVFVLTSVTEGFPNVVVEAMAQGMPVVSVNHPGPTGSILGAVKDSAYGKYGMVVPMLHEKQKDDAYWEGVRKLSEAVTLLLTDQVLHQKYVKRSLERAGYFKPGKIERLWKRLCEEAE